MVAHVERRSLSRWLRATVEGSAGASYRDAPSRPTLRVERTLPGALARVALFATLIVLFVGGPAFMGYGVLFGTQGAEWSIPPIAGKALIVIFCAVFAGASGLVLWFSLRDAIRNVRKREILRASDERIEFFDETVGADEVERVSVRPPNDDSEWAVFVVKKDGTRVDCGADIPREDDARWLASALVGVLPSSASPPSDSGLRIAVTPPDEVDEDSSVDEGTSRGRERA